MSLQAKLDEASRIVSEHNASLPESLKDKSLKWDDIHHKIIEAGGTSEENLRSLTWEDLQECGLPKLLARRIANDVFRKQEPKPDQSYVPRIITETRAAAMGHEDLLNHFDPEGERNPAVAKRLMELSGGKPFIVYDPNGRVVIPLSVRLLKEIRSGQPPRTNVDLEGKQVRTWPANARPMGYADENPLYPKHPLRDDQTCTLTDRSWAPIPHQARQILYLALTQTRELKIQNQDDIHDVLDRLSGQDSHEAITSKVSNRYPKASLLLSEMEERGQTLPLKIAKGQSGIILPGKENDPFYGDGTRHVRT